LYAGKKAVQRGRVISSGFLIPGFFLSLMWHLLTCA
jgi:hypothetical protein